MIIRIVKMTFEPEKVKDFLSVFDEVKHKIKNHHGCLYLELLNDIESSNVFFTYSRWSTENDLQNYRNSELFESTWKKTKAMFAAKAEAWSVISTKMF